MTHATHGRTHCARSTYLGRVNVGNTFGLVVNLRTFVWSRYTAAWLLGGPASRTRNAPLAGGVNRFTTR